MKLNHIENWINLARKIARPTSMFMGIGLSCFYVLYSMMVLNEMPDLFGVGAILFPTVAVPAAMRSFDKRRVGHEYTERFIYGGD